MQLPTGANLSPVERILAFREALIQVGNDVPDRDPKSVLAGKEIQRIVTGLRRYEVIGYLNQLISLSMCSQREVLRGILLSMLIDSDVHLFGHSEAQDGSKTNYTPALPRDPIALLLLFLNADLGGHSRLPRRRLKSKSGMAGFTRSLCRALQLGDKLSEVEACVSFSALCSVVGLPSRVVSRIPISNINSHVKVKKLLSTSGVDAYSAKHTPVVVTDFIHRSFTRSTDTRVPLTTFNRELFKWSIDIDNSGSFWTEVYCQTHKRWLVIDPFRGLIRLDKLSSPFLSAATLHGSSTSKQPEALFASLFSSDSYRIENETLDVSQVLKEIRSKKLFKRKCTLTELFAPWWKIHLDLPAKVNIAPYESLFFDDESDSSSSSELLPEKLPLKRPRSEPHVDVNASPGVMKRFNILEAFDSGVIFDPTVGIDKAGQIKTTNHNKHQLQSPKSYLKTSTHKVAPGSSSPGATSARLKQSSTRLPFEQDTIEIYPSNYSLIDRTNDLKTAAWSRSFRKANDVGEGVGIVIGITSDRHNVLHLCDVTLRYCSHWSSIVKARGGDVIGPPNFSVTSTSKIAITRNSGWLTELLRSCNATFHQMEPGTRVDQNVACALLVDEVALTPIHMEDEPTQKMCTGGWSSPLPATLAGFKKHPLYVLESQLTKRQMILPKDPISGYFKGEPVYSRRCVWELLTENEWRRRGRVILNGAEGVSIAKKRLPHLANPNKKMKTLSGQASLQLLEKLLESHGEEMGEDLFGDDDLGTNYEALYAEYQTSPSGDSWWTELRGGVIPVDGGGICRIGRAYRGQGGLGWGSRKKADHGFVETEESMEAQFHDRGDESAVEDMVQPLDELIGVSNELLPYPGCFHMSTEKFPNITKLHNNIFNPHGIVYARACVGSQFNTGQRVLDDVFDGVIVRATDLKKILKLYLAYIRPQMIEQRNELGKTVRHRAGVISHRMLYDIVETERNRILNGITATGDNKNWRSWLGEQDDVS